ncbi:MAG TPA: hypothetical protein PLF03_03860 [Candidatus Omnitrophota bacterium]|nr:hypothetical protein [Candidatus Omnitrophota bacterium]
MALTSSDANKVLIVSYNFPPVNSPGVYRIIGFLKHLKTFGYEPIVLTVKNPFGDVVDESMTSCIPVGTEVHRVFSFEIDRLKTNIIDFLKNAGSRSCRGGSDSNSARGRGSNIFSSYLKDIEKFLFLPDRKIGCIPQLCLCALWICWLKKVKFIFISSPPHSLHLVGVFLKKVLGVNVISDFRDPWGNELISRSVFARCINLAIEKTVLKNSDCVIANTDGLKLKIKNKHTWLEEDKIEVITNGFDRNEMQSYEMKEIPAPIKRGDKLSLVFIGTIYPGMIDGFIKALEELYNSNKEISTLIRITFAGTLSESDIGQFDKVGLRDMVSYLGFISRKASIKCIQESDILLLFLPDNEQFNSCIPSKVFDYILTAKPIFALIPEGDTTRFLQKTKTGICIAPNNVNEIKTIILRLLDDFHADKIKIDPDWCEIEKFNRYDLTKKLVRIFDLLKSK